MKIEEAFYIKSLILKDFSGEIDEAEKQILEAWTIATPENRRLREQIVSRQFMQQVVTDESALVEEQWAKISQKTIHPVRKFRSRFYKYAAIILFPVLVGTFFWLYPSESSSDIPIISENTSAIRIQLSDGRIIPLGKDTTTSIEIAGISIRNNRDSLQLTSLGTAAIDNRWNKIIIPKAMDYIVRLEDGTSIHLNAESTLEVPNHFSIRERRIRLSGGAYFNVRHEDGRPFIVETANSRIKVLGTQFDLRAYPGTQKTMTTLIHGSVEVAHGNQKVVLKPGYQAIVSPTEDIRVQAVNSRRYTAWRDRRLVFENEYITDIIEELQHWYDYSFIITDPEIREIRLSMNIERFDDFNDLKTALEKTGKIHFQIRDQVIKIVP